MIEKFLTYLRTELALAPLTVSAYRADLQQWEQYMRADHPKGEFSPMDYTTADLRLWIASLSRQGYSPRSIRRKASALKSLYRFLMKNYGLASNPASDLILARGAKALPVFIRPEETSALLDEPYDTTDFTEVRNRLILLMLYSTGMRSAEMMGLLDVNVDCAACELKVHGKRNKDRIIPFGEELKEMITTYRTLRNRDIATGDTPQFFVLESGKPLYRKALYNIVNERLRGSVHASRFSPHVLRHSFATDMLNGGAQINAVSSLMGHASLASTQVYTHISYRELKQNYQSAHPRAQKKGENYGSKN